MDEPSAQLLVSVRSAAEARAALAGGAHLIDVKEPRRGSLGRASDATIAEVVRAVGGLRPVSAALGELAGPAESAVYPGPGLSFAKWGLSGLGKRPDWRERWRDAATRVAEAAPACRLVAVAYADWQLVGAPTVAEVSALACEHPAGVLLVDTFQKAPPAGARAAPTLLDLMSVEEVVRLCRLCRDAGVRVALAGSLGAAQIAALRAARPDWFAVRRAACEAGRESTVSPSRVRALLRLLREKPSAPSCHLPHLPLR
jgi:uncharacterized protein (UPF0264 family)